MNTSNVFGVVRVDLTQEDVESGRRIRGIEKIVVNTRENECLFIDIARLVLEEPIGGERWRNSLHLDILEVISQDRTHTRKELKLVKSRTKQNKYSEI